MAGGPVPRLVLDELRVDFGADLLRFPAARVEAAPRRWVHRRGHVARQDDPLAFRLDRRVGDRYRGEQRLAVRVEGTFVEVDPVRELDDLPEVHHCDAVADVTHHGQVVRDEQIGQLEAVLQLFEKIDDLGLNRDVKRRDRLVAHDELRLDGECPRDPDALALATRELMRVAVGEVRVETDDTQELLDALGLLFPAGEVVDLERFADDVSNRHAGIQGRVRVLKDHLHAATHLAHRFAAELRELDAVEQHGAGRGLVELEDRAAGRRLPASGLADKAQRLALLDEEVDPVDGAHRPDLTLEDDPLRQREVHLQRLYIEEVLAAVDGRRASEADVVRIRGLRRCGYGHLCTSYNAVGGGGTSPPFGSGGNCATSCLISSMMRVSPTSLRQSMSTSQPPCCVPQQRASWSGLAFGMCS